MPQTFQIAVIEGDGIGPEVTREAIRAVEAAAPISDAAFQWSAYPWGTDHYMTHGRMAPHDFLESLAQPRCNLARRRGTPPGSRPRHAEWPVAADSPAFRPVHLPATKLSLPGREQPAPRKSSRIDRSPRFSREYRRRIRQCRGATLSGHWQKKSRFKHRSSRAGGVSGSSGPPSRKRERVLAAEWRPSPRATRKATAWCCGTKCSRRWRPSFPISGPNRSSSIEP